MRKYNEMLVVENFSVELSPKGILLNCVHGTGGFMFIATDDATRLWNLQFGGGLMPTGDFNDGIYAIDQKWFEGNVQSKEDCTKLELALAI